MVREHLECADTAWGTIKKTDGKHLEKVQRATKIVPSIRDLPYRERLQQLKLPSLGYKRNRGDMIQMYKILYGLEDIPDDNLFKLAKDGPIRDHSLKLHKP